MKVQVRNYLLNQVSIVLNECYKLVSQLSEVVPEDYQVCQEVSSRSVPTTSPSESEINYDDFWWDEYRAELSQFSADFYCLLSPVNVDHDQHEDDQHQHDDHHEAPEQQPRQYRRSECLLSPARDPGDGCCLRPDDCQSSNPANFVQCPDANLSKRRLLYTPTPNYFLNKLLSFLSTAAPNNVYNAKWKEDKIDNFIDPEFREMWRNVLTIFGEDDEEEDIVSVLPPLPPIRYPTIDITKCNTRSIANVPKPQKFPILGCSTDPEFYVLSHSCYKASGDFYKCYPYGAKYGYRTNLGIVPVPDKPVHGYVWDGTDDSSDWVLHAVKPKDRCNTKRIHDYNFKPKGQRKRG